MDTRTLEIKEVAEVMTASQAMSKGLIPIPLEEVALIESMTLDERAKWAGERLAKFEAARAYPGKGNRRQRRKAAAERRANAKSKGGA